MAAAIDTDGLFAQSVSIADDVLVQELPDEELVFLDLRTESYFGLDRVGTRMFRALTEAPTVGAAHARLLETFDVSEAQLRADLAAFVSRMVDRRLLAVRG